MAEKDTRDEEQGGREGDHRLVGPKKTGLHLFLNFAPNYMVIEEKGQQQCSDELSTLHPRCLSHHPFPYLLELPFTDSISVEDDTVRLEPCTLVELDQHLPHHGGKLADDLLSVRLDSYCCTVATGVSIHAGDKLMGGRKGR